MPGTDNVPSSDPAVCHRGRIPDEGAGKPDDPCPGQISLFRDRVPGYLGEKWLAQRQRGTLGQRRSVERVGRLLQETQDNHAIWNEEPICGKNAGGNGENEWNAE